MVGQAPPPFFAGDLCCWSHKLVGLGPCASGAARKVAGCNFTLLRAIATEVSTKDQASIY